MDKQVMMQTKNCVYYLTLSRKHWWNEWEIKSIGSNLIGNEEPVNFIEQIK